MKTWPCMPENCREGSDSVLWGLGHWLTLANIRAAGRIFLTPQRGNRYGLPEFPQEEVRGQARVEFKYVRLLSSGSSSHFSVPGQPWDICLEESAGGSCSLSWLLLVISLSASVFLTVSIPLSEGRVSTYEEYI